MAVYVVTYFYFDTDRAMGYDSEIKLLGVYHSYEKAYNCLMNYKMKIEDNITDDIQNVYEYEMKQPIEKREKCYQNFIDFLGSLDYEQADDGSYQCYEDEMFTYQLTKTPTSITRCMIDERDNRQEEKVVLEWKNIEY